jgi:hypothetical protein
VRELGVDMAQWAPVVEGRALVPWLVRPPTDDERLAARRLTPAQIGVGGCEGRERWGRGPDLGG